MLTELAIQNVVLIEKCSFPLASGLCVLTGETGAGKSILLDALGLTLGTRAEARLVRQGKDQAQVSATFDITGDENTHDVLRELGLEDSDEVIIRRTLSSDGKTRCFINDVAVSVAALKSIGETLIEVHGQHDGRGLLNPATHRQMLDAYGELQSAGKKTSDAFVIWQTANETLASARRRIEEARREQDYLQHMQKELGALGPKMGEEETLAGDRTLMMQSEKVAQTLADAKAELEGDKGATSMLHGAHRMLARSSLNSDNRFAAAIDALDIAREKVAEAENEIERLLMLSQYDPHKLEQMEERLFALRGAARKYNVTVDELAVLLDDVNKKLRDLKQGEQELGALENTVSESKINYLAAAEKLSAGRAKAGKNLSKAVNGELESLKMGATTFHVMMEPLAEEKWGAGGIDAVRFEAATHKGASLSPLHKIASGGELSRFMLAMKVAMAKVKSMPTIIFDEIDTGTGGAVADAIGKRLAELGKTHQVLVVTHLPQVAARGSHHLQVIRTEKASVTSTRVEVLEPKARKEELARMLAGAEVTVEARKAAEKLLQAAS